MSCTASKGSQHDFLRGTLPGALMSLLAIVLLSANPLKKYSEPSGNMQIRPNFRKSSIFIVEDGEGFVTIFKVALVHPDDMKNSNIFAKI